MKIQTIDELLDFIETNYEKLSNEKYIELLKLTLQVYVSEKPSSKEKAIDRLLDLYSFTQKYDSVTEMPLFVD